MKRLLFILLLASATAHGQINNPVTAGSLGLGWSALTNAQSTLYSGQATQLLGYAPEIAGGSTNLTGFNVLGYTNTNSLVIPANILIGEDQTVGGPRNARNVTVNGAVTIQYPYSSPSAIYANNSIAATDASTYTNTLVTWSSNAATFATNVTVNGALTVGSLATTTPSTWALDATQAGSTGPTTFGLALPDNANVIRLTNNYPIRQVSNGRLGAFYYVINQSGSSLAIDHTNGITVQGGKSLTLANNESATLVATGPTNVSVANRGDLTDVALGGTANTAPSQTASSGSSLMTRDLGDSRYAPRTMDAFVVDDFWGGGNGAQFVGKLGWYAYDGASWAYGGFTADIPGTWRLQNSSVTNGRAALESSQFGSRGRDWTWQWTFRLNKITQARWAFGNFPNDISARSAASGHFGVYYDSTNSSNWHVYVSNGSTNTVTDTGIAATTDYAAIKMSYVGTNLTVAIANSSLVFGAPVAIPTTALGTGVALNIPSVYINNLDGNAQSVDLDRMWIYGRFPNRD